MSGTATVYNGPSGGLKEDSPWLASEDIGLDRAVKVKIEAVEIHKNVKFDKGRSKQRVGALKFHGKEKRLILNSTNRKTMVRHFGMNCAGWKDAEVELYVDPNVDLMGEKVCGLRIRIPNLNTTTNGESQ